MLMTKMILITKMVKTIIVVSLLLLLLQIFILQ